MTNKLKVFVIEDAVKIRDRLIEMLQQLRSVDVVGYADGQTEALNQLRSIAWDLVIVDIRLREGNGLAVLAALQNDEKNYGTRIVLTCSPSTELKKRSLALGASALFDKSFDMDILVNYLRSIGC